ncbi:mitochondrial dicarboxylate/tricarboxylate transporter DTC [Artemisia annua]|uniref:Mitochondrial dicarboxylate/tricarboxylate transporter DTC n=1 Tax=Artemisia annua TaxID=35608 RepID=A0A2U1MAP6_ARTAN|nr:mitochondrial dicarboxylate/tricarboxylate transporter DTC [Artemisia annua]
MGEEKAKPIVSGVWPTVKPFVNGGASGMLATCVIQPIDMIKVRIQLGQGSAGSVTKNMLKNEGIGAFYKRCSFFYLSAFLVFITFLLLPSSYITLRAKPIVLSRVYPLDCSGKLHIQLPDLVHSGASSVSGFFAAACSLPFDYVKTQIQKMQPDAEGKLPYTGSLDCTMKTLKAGGPFKFYSGFPVYCVRIAPHVMMTWIFLNQIQKLEKKAGL